jgi:uncharacterized membrane protein YccC
MLAAEVVDQSLAVWVVGAVAAGILGVLGFLVRNAFEGVSRGLEGLSTKLDAMSKDIARQDGDRRALERDLAALVQRVDRMEREFSEGVAR